VAIVMQKLSIPRPQAMQRLDAAHGRLRVVLEDA
jgi:hypothetical protein